MAIPVPGWEFYLATLIHTFIIPLAFLPVSFRTWGGLASKQDALRDVSACML